MKKMKFPLILLITFGIFNPAANAYFGSSPCHFGEFTNPVDFTNDLKELLKSEIVCSPSFEYVNCGRQILNHEYRPVIICQSGARFTDTKRVYPEGSSSKEQKRSAALLVAQQALEKADFTLFSKLPDVSFFYNPNNEMGVAAEELAVFFHYSKKVNKGWTYSVDSFPFLYEINSIQRVSPFDFGKKRYQVLQSQLKDQPWHLPRSGSAFLRESSLLIRIK